MKHWLPSPELNYIRHQKSPTRHIIPGRRRIRHVRYLLQPDENETISVASSDETIQSERTISCNFVSFFRPTFKTVVVMLPIAPSKFSIKNAGRTNVHRRPSSDLMCRSMAAFAARSCRRWSSYPSPPRSTDENTKCETAYSFARSATS